MNQVQYQNFLPGQVMLGEAKLSLTSFDPAKLTRCWTKWNTTSVLKTYSRFQPTLDTQRTCHSDNISQFANASLIIKSMR